jgi:putative chitinase
MAVLRQGAQGPSVTALQQALKDHGFDPGPIDGSFGPGTATAVRSFQTSAGLEPDGVAGTATAEALGLPAPVPPVPGPDITVKVTVDMVARMFPGTPVRNIAANLPIVLQALRVASLGDKSMVLMALGTIRAETASFEPIPEGQSEFNTSPGGHPFDLYDNRADLGNRGAPDGASYKGRGFVQLTGRANYTRFSPRAGAGVDLVKDLEQACNPATAALLLALFLKDKEHDIRNAIQAGDLGEARKLVNGGHHGQADFDAAFTTGEQVIPAA